MPDLPLLLQWVTETLDVEVRHWPLPGQAGLAAYRVDLSRLRMKLSEAAPCIEVSREVAAMHSPVQLKRLLMDAIYAQGWHRRNVLVLMPGEADDLKLLCKNETLPPLVLDEAAQTHITSGGPNTNQLVNEISKQTSIAALSPYEISSPVTGEQFFGRERELREIQQNASTNFLVVGNRRMGKTSLVREARRRAKRELPDGDETHLYFDCSVFRNKQEFYAEIIRGLDGPREIERLYNDHTFSIHSFIQRMSRAKKTKVVLYLDEIDFLLDWDAADNWQVLSTLRAMTAMDQGHSTHHQHHAAHTKHDGAEREDRQPLRVIMAGFRRAQHWAEQKDAPLFNFASTIRVTNFDHRVTEQLVTEPMLTLGLSITDRSALVNRIYKETGGQPNLVQHYCKFMLRQLEDSGAREVSQRNLDAVLGDDTIRRRTTDELMANSTNFEQFVVLSFIDEIWSKKETDKFTLEKLDFWLYQHGIKLPRTDLEEALYALETSGLISRDGKSYGFAFGVLPRMISENWDVKYQLRKILEEGVV